MIGIYIISCRGYTFESIVSNHCDWLTRAVLDKAMTYRLEEDAKRFLLGRILLREGLKKMKAPSLVLDEILYTDHKKPHIPGGYHFNISHSGEYIVCAISPDQQLGIDVEEIKEASIADYASCFNATETESIISSTEPLHAFYRLWTLKEAVSKADGRGMYIPLLDFEVEEDKVRVFSNLWHVNEIPVAPGYICHLATRNPVGSNYFVHRFYQ